MRLVLSARVSKPGTLRFLARRASQPAPASAQALLDDVAARSVAAANFTGSAPLAAGGQLTTVTLCVADGDEFVVHAVAQDREGDNAGRWPNNSTLVSAAVARADAPAHTSCEPAHFLAPLRPTLTFDAAGPGLLLGDVGADVDAATGATTWTQLAGAFMRQPALQSAQASAAVGAVFVGAATELAVVP